MDGLIGGLIDGLIDGLTHLLVESLFVCLIDWLIFIRWQGGWVGSYETGDSARNEKRN